jgi:hypothetical protein
MGSAGATLRPDKPKPREERPATYPGRSTVQQASHAIGSSVVEDDGPAASCQMVIAQLVGPESQLTREISSRSRAPMPSPREDEASWPSRVGGPCG